MQRSPKADPPCGSAALLRSSSRFNLRFCVDFLLWSVLLKARGRASQLWGWL